VPMLRPAESIRLGWFLFGLEAAGEGGGGPEITSERGLWAYEAPRRPVGEEGVMRQQAVTPLDREDRAEFPSCRIERGAHSRATG